MNNTLDGNDNEHITNKVFGTLNYTELLPNGD